MNLLNKVLLVFFVLNLMLIVPTNMSVENLESYNTAQASGLLTREDAANLEGKIVSGYDNISVIQTDGTVFSNDTYLYDQRDVSAWKDITQIDQGHSHTVGLQKNGTVIATGYNSYGETNVNDWTDIVQIAATSSFTAGLKKDGSVVATGFEAQKRINFKETAGIKAIAIGSEHTVGLKENHTVVAAGGNTFGQADVAEWHEIVAVAAEGYHTVGLKKDGTVVAAGNNTYGQLNVQDWSDIVSISTSSMLTMGLKSDGTVLAAGYEGFAHYKVAGWTDIVAISVGDTQVIGMKSDGSILIAGYNDWGQSEVSDWTNIKSIAAAQYQSIGLRKDGTVIAAGYNEYGQINVNDWKGIKAVAAGMNHTVGLKEDGTVIATGSNAVGQLNVESWTDIIAVVAGERYTAGLKIDGTVVVAGPDTYTLISEVASWKNIAALYGEEGLIFGIRTDGTVVASGKNQYGSLKDIATWEDVVAIEAGDSHTLALKGDGTLFFMGYNSYGLETAAKEWTDIKAITASKSYQFGLKKDGTLVGSGDFEHGITKASKWTNLTSISSGYNHIIGLKKDGTVVAAESLPEDKSISAGTISVNHQIVKPNDKIEISLKNTPLFINKGNEVELLNKDSVVHKSTMIANNDAEQNFSYLVKPSDSGNIDIKFPEIYDLFGKSIEKNKAFQVIPLQSVTSSKLQTQAGNKITLTASFYQSVKEDFKIALSGGAELSPTEMQEVAGSNGKKYTIDYKVPANYTEGAVDVSLKNVSTLDGTVFESYTENAVFTKTNNSLPIESLTASKSLGKAGDKISITANFLQPIKPGVQLTFEGEDYPLPPVTMTEVAGSNGKKFIYTYPIEKYTSYKFDARITEAYDENDSLYKEYRKGNLFVADGSGPSLRSLESSAATGKLGDKILLTATFTEAIKPSVKISFYMGAVLAPTLMKEVAGSNGTKYSYEYTVDSKANSKVYATIHGMEDIAGNKYSNFSGQNESNYYSGFKADGVKPEIASFIPDKKVYEAGEVASFTVNLKEPVKSTMKIKLAGAINEEYDMTQIDDQTFEFHYVIPADSFGNVNVKLTGYEDLAGNTNEYSKSSAFFISDPTNADLSKVSIKAGTQEYQLTPAFSPDIYSYRMTVPSSVSSLAIGAVAEDLNTKVTGSGNVNVKIGDNIVTLTSTSKDGTKKTYKITVSVKVMPPTSLKAASNSYNSIKASWAQVQGVSGYEVYQSTSSNGTYSKVGIITSGKTLTYTSSSLSTGKTYYYKVRAYHTVDGKKVYSSFSSVASAKPALTAATSVKAASAGYDKIKVSWNKVSGASGYEVHRATSSNGTYSNVKTVASGSTTSYENGSLSTGRTYYYKVRAYRTVDGKKVYGSFSSIVSTKPALGTVTSAKAASAGYSKNKISWAKTSGASGYEVYRSTSKAGTYTKVKAITNGSAVSYENTGLTTGKTYYYKVRAYRTVSGKNVYGAYSGIVNAAPTLASPAKITVAKASSTAIKTTWSKVTEASGYELYRATSKSGTYTKVKTQTSGSSISYTNIGLNKGKTYYYKVRAYRTVNGKKVYSLYAAIGSTKL